MAITLYSPEVETYVVAMHGSLFKVEKVIVKESKGKLSLSYVCVDSAGLRVIVDSTDEDLESFVMDGNAHEITEESLDCILDIYTPEGQKQIVDQLELFGLKFVKMIDGGKLPFSEYIERHSSEK